jgi:hypothetical protein
MDLEPHEPVLPYTPTNTGRRARVGYLGLEGIGFEALWPLFGGLAASVGLGLWFFVGSRPAPGAWPSKTIEAAFPVCAGYGYLRFLVQGRPPHFKRDLAARALRLRLDFADPPLPVLPIIPRVVDAAEEPGRSRDGKHPMRRPGRRGL